MAGAEVKQLHCNQHHGLRPASEFLPRRPGQKTQNCASCREKARLGLRVENHRTGLPTDSPLRVTVVPHSHNQKLGGIPAVLVTASTCPPSCRNYNAGCFGESHLLRKHWRDVEIRGVPWDDMCEFVDRLPDDQLWRYATVGDMPGVGEAVNEKSLLLLISANVGKRGFTFSHKRSQAALNAIKVANAMGFTINLSADNIAEADAFMDLGIGPVVATVPEDAPAMGIYTDSGRQVLLCPATTRKGVTCATCGICARQNRKYIIGFRAHGQDKAQVSERARLPVLS